MRLGILLLVSSWLYGLALVAMLRLALPGWFRTAGARARLWTCTGVAMVGVTALELLGRRYAPLGGGAWRPFVATERIVMLVTLVTTVLVVPVVIAAWTLVRASELLSHRAITIAPDRALAAGITRREAVVQAVALATFGTASTAAMVGSRYNRHALEVTEVTLVVPDLPPALEGVTLIQLTDLHIGMFTGAAELDHLVETVRRLRGDLVVLTGDVMDHNPRHIPGGMRALGRLRAPLGVYGILGNHDHLTGGAAVARGMTAVGIRPLVNASVLVQPSGRDPLVLAGVDDVVARRLGPGRGPDLTRALQGTPSGAPRVLLAHNPAYFDEVRGRVAVQLSGHTHGGQINVGGVARVIMPYVAGRYERSGSTLYVSRGVGITGAPVRLAAAPEVTRIALTGRRT